MLSIASFEGYPNVFVDKGDWWNQDGEQTLVLTIGKKAQHTTSQLKISFTILNGLATQIEQRITAYMVTQGLVDEFGVVVISEPKVTSASWNSPRIGSSWFDFDEDNGLGMTWSFNASSTIPQGSYIEIVIPGFTLERSVKLSLENVGQGASGVWVGADEALGLTTTSTMVCGVHSWRLVSSTNLKRFHFRMIPEKYRDANSLRIVWRRMVG
jgi:hypothetical protein